MSGRAEFVSRREVVVVVVVDWRGGMVVNCGAGRMGRFRSRVEEVEPCDMCWGTVPADEVRVGYAGLAIVAVRTFVAVDDEAGSRFMRISPLVGVGAALL